MTWEAMTDEMEFFHTLPFKSLESVGVFNVKYLILAKAAFN